MESSGKNHFDLLGLKREFALDPAALEKAYLALQKVVHPDRFAGAGEVQRRLAMQMAAQVNEAHKTLRTPAQRAGYMCQLAGVDIGLETNTSMPGEFLMQQMAWREALDEAQGDAGMLAKLRAEAESTGLGVQMQLHQAIDEQQDFLVAAGLTRQLLFIDKFLEDLSHRG